MPAAHAQGERVKSASHSRRRRRYRAEPGALTWRGRLSYTAASARKRCRNRSRCREAHLPAQQTCSQAPPRLPGADGDGRRSPGARGAAGKGPQAAVGLRRRSRAASIRTRARAEIPLGGRLATLKIRADFLRVAAGRRKAVTPGLDIAGRAAAAGLAGGRAVRVGFTASRKVGNAVVRNRAKRRLRAAAAEILPDRGKSRDGLRADRARGHGRAALSRHSSTISPRRCAGSGAVRRHARHAPQRRGLKTDRLTP